MTDGSGVLGKGGKGTLKWKRDEERCLIKKDLSVTQCLSLHDLSIKSPETISHAGQMKEMGLSYPEKKCRGHKIFPHS